MFKLGLASLLLFSSMSLLAMQLPLPSKDSDVVGQIQFGQAQAGDSISSFARRYDMGFFEVAEANPEVNPDHPLANSELIVPSQFILPHVPRQGIVVNLATMRLYYFPKGKKYFYTYPVGIGKQSWNSPQGNWHIMQKIKNPVWEVPPSIYQYRLTHGDPVPHVVPSGPQNPLGYFALRLSNPTYLIHGTDDPTSVGRRSSAGCIHLYPEDIKALFSMVSVDTPVLIINQPYLIGRFGNQIMLAAHLPLAEQRNQLGNVSADVVALVNSIDVSGAQIDWQKAQDVLREHTGIPTQINS